MKAIGNYVLVRQTVKKKVKNIILPKSAEENKDNYIISFEILQFGKEADKKAKELDIKVGDKPIFSSHSQPQIVNIVDKETMLIIIHIEDILGVED